MEVFNHIGNILDVIAIFIFYDRMVGRDKRRFPIPIILFIMFAINEVTYFLSSSVTSSLVFVIISIIIFVLFSFTYTTKMHIRFFLSIGYEIVAYASEIIVAQLIKVFVGDAVLDGNAFIIGMLLSKLVTMMLVGLIAFIFKCRMYVKEWYNILGIFICQVICVILMLIMTRITLSSDTSFDPLICAMSILIIVLNVALYFVIEQISTLEKLRAHQLTLSNDLKLQQANYVAIESQYKAISSYAHDVNKHLRTVLKLLQEDNTASAQEYISTSLNVGKVSDYIHTGSSVIDVIVNDLIAKCNLNGITFEYSMDFSPDNIGATDYDLTTILGNIVDNAYTAALHVTEPSLRIINLKIFHYGPATVVKLSNGYNPSFSSLRKGIGMENIEKTIVSVYGSYKHSVSDNMYYVTISFPPKI